VRAPSSPIQTDTLARILADQGHIDEARAMLQHLQTQRPRAQRDEALTALRHQETTAHIKRLSDLLAHIKSRS